MFNLDMIHTSIANGFAKGFLYIGCHHGCKELPGDDLSTEVIQNRKEIIKTSSNDSEYEKCLKLLLRWEKLFQ